MNIPKTNPLHKYWIVDCNGFTRTSATTKPAALKRARALAHETGLHMMVCFSDRTPFGTQHHVVNVRCKRTDVQQVLNLNGSWSVKGRV